MGATARRHCRHRIRISEATYTGTALHTVMQQALHIDTGMRCTSRMATCGGARAACMCGWWPRVAMAMCSSRMPVRVDVSCGVSPSTNRNACIRSLAFFSSGRLAGPPCRPSPSLHCCPPLLPPAARNYFLAAGSLRQHDAVGQEQLGVGVEQRRRQ